MWVPHPFACRWRKGGIQESCTTQGSPVARIFLLWNMWVVFNRRAVLCAFAHFGKNLVTFVPNPPLFFLEIPPLRPYAERIDPAEVSMSSQPLIIRTCRHILDSGYRCQGTAVRGRACCRHHLDSRTRLHNMARARRCVRLPRLLVPKTFRDLAYNWIEVNRVLASERIDHDAARMMLWAMDLTATILPAEPDTGLHRTRNPNVSYQVPINHLFAGSCIVNPSQVHENTWEEGRGLPPPSQLGNPTSERVGFVQPRKDNRSKSSPPAPESRKGNAGPGSDAI
jgi:hypothetical protein